MRIATSSGLLFGLASLASAVQYGYNHAKVLPDSEIVERAFKDVDIDLLSPAFQDPDVIQSGFANGTQGPSSQDDMESFLRKLARGNKYMTYHTLDFASEEGRSFPYIHLKAHGRRKGHKKVRVWIQGAVHGNEPAADEATQALLGKFDANPKWASKVLDKLEIIVLPRYNPDGVYYFQRTLATNLDPNRDHIKLARQHTRDIKNFFNEFNAHVVVDMHEYTASTPYGSEGQYRHGSDGLYAAAKNLNIDEGIRELAEGLFAGDLVQAMEDADLRVEPYVTGSPSEDPELAADFAEAGSDVKIGRNAMGLTQAVVFLIEMRGIGIADQEFQRRTAAGLTMLNSVVQTAADNADEVYKTVEEGAKRFIKSKEDIVITDYSESEIRPFTMVDIRNGSVVTPPVRFTSTTPTIANLTRARPEAYLIPVAWSDLAERLRTYGLKVQTLRKGFEGTVEALTITSTEIESSYYEGVLRVKTTAETNERELKLPAGSFLVSTRQKNAGLAIGALEPENIDSYASFNIIPVKEGDEYPIFRVIS